MIASKDSPNVDGLNAASCKDANQQSEDGLLFPGPTDAVSISAVVGGLPLGPFFAMIDRRCRQYLAIMSTRPSICTVCWCMKDRKYCSKFFEGGNVTSRTQSSCQPLKRLSLDTFKWISSISTQGDTAKILTDWHCQSAVSRVDSIFHLSALRVPVLH